MAMQRDKNVLLILATPERCRNLLARFSPLVRLMQGRGTHSFNPYKAHSSFCELPSGVFRMRPNYLGTTLCATGII